MRRGWYVYKETYGVDRKRTCDVGHVKCERSTEREREREIEMETPRKGERKRDGDTEREREIQRLREYGR